MSECVKPLPLDERIKNRARELNCNLVNFKPFGEGAFVGVLENEGCVGPVAFVVGHRLDIKDWTMFTTYEEVFPNLFAYHSCTSIQPNGYNQEQVDGMTNDAKQFINSLRDHVYQRYKTKLAS